MANFHMLTVIVLIIGTTCFLPTMCYRVSSVTISSPKVTDWGTWGDWEYCPCGGYAVAFQLKAQGGQGSGDDTGLSGIRLTCSDGTKITSKVGGWGDWRQLFECKQGLTGFNLRCEEPQGSADDTAANNIKMFCKGHYWLDGDGESWGSYSGRQMCPSGQRICGIRTQVEDTHCSDDTALNNVEMLCCS